jgi:cytochrome bd-type quinol oxidase subunit 1
MEDNDLLDDAGILQDQSILDLIQWWEKRRLLYNIIVGLVGSAAVFFMLERNHYIFSSEVLLFIVLPFGIFANIAYLAGWVIDLLLRYYFKIRLSLASRKTLYWLGTAISIAPLLFVIVILLT